MEATKIGDDTHRFYTTGTSLNDVRGVEKKRLEWDLNDWKWDGDLFIATPVKSIDSDCQNKRLFPLQNGEIRKTSGFPCSSFCTSEANEKVVTNGKGESEKRKRIISSEEGDDLNTASGSLSLNLGNNNYPISTENEAPKYDLKSGKKTKLQANNINRIVCQVEGCGIDLENVKDYHRRHKVCEIHAKASTALVGDVLQRFCQQCSRFHSLQEFDEGKRSCRRRLAGHNRRRRKTHPDTVTCGSTLNIDQSSSFLLITLLKLLSNLHSNNQDEKKDGDVLSDILRNLSNFAGSLNGQSSQNVKPENETLELLPVSLSDDVIPLSSISSLINENATLDSFLKLIDRFVPANTDTSKRNPSREMIADISYKSIDVRKKSPIPAEASCSLNCKVSSERTPVSVKPNNFDLNSLYDESANNMDESERAHDPAAKQNNSPSSFILQDSTQLSPAQASGYSDAVSTHSASTSTGDTQCRTDRIIFKLFGKDPSEFPCSLRAQILDWLSHTPSDIESYIRPGCIILTVYVRLSLSQWSEVISNLRFNLTRFLNVTNEIFWKKGWIYAMVQDRIILFHNGVIFFDTPLMFEKMNFCKITSIIPIAAPISTRVEFTIKGSNLSPATRFLCALGGKYIQEVAHSEDTMEEYDDFLHCQISCIIPNETGRGFIEVEDHELNHGAFPFIVAEKDVCAEIRMLESTIEMTENEIGITGERNKVQAKNQALDFLNEIGWLLRKSHLRSILDTSDSLAEIFPLSRFRWLFEFSFERDWCAVIKKLLDILFEGTVDMDSYPSIHLVLLEMNLLHRAVRRKCCPMVDLLLKYIPHKRLENRTINQNERTGELFDSFLFRPDMSGPAGVSPLHVAASSKGMDSVLEALTNDPQQIGLQSWNNVRDNSGFTPKDYALQHGHNSYISLVQAKMDKISKCEHVIVNIPGVNMDDQTRKMQSVKDMSSPITGFQVDKAPQITNQNHCKLCSQRQPGINPMYGALFYRPAMLSIVAIAAVCVCVALLFKGPPEVLFVFRPFRWELLNYGSM